MGSPTDAQLDEMQWIADPPADEAVAAILGSAHSDADKFRRIDELNATIRGWQTNADVAAWRGDERLERFLKAALVPPAWIERDRVDRAEEMFMDYGALSVTVLFCASLPECYVVPDLAAVLHATGQLEDRVEHRIRTTGAMIFPVMMDGGLVRPGGSGVAQILKVRLIHAMVRHLILRGTPEAAAKSRAVVPPLEAIESKHSMSRALHVHGWDFRVRALPNNQEELAYTLLTFSYVFLRSMRRLGIAFTPEKEKAYLHAWNVAGHYLGVRRELMVDAMEEAAELFARMQGRGRAESAKRDATCDPRPRLAAALMDAMKTVFPEGPWKSFPILLTRRLLERESIRDLQLDGRVSWPARILFRLVMAAARGFDALMRIFFPHFSLCRLITRIAGYRLTCALLMNQTRELAVPATLRPGVKALIGRWGRDPRASSRMNALEDRFTVAGDWEAL